MPNDILFTERQRFYQPWLWVLVIALDAILVFAVLRRLISDHRLENLPMSQARLLVLCFIMFLLTIAFIFFRLETQIRNDGIYIRFYPFHNRFIYYSWDTISRSFMRKYSPLQEYGGWGIRFSLAGSGKAYNVSGNEGIQLVFTSGAKLLIGTNKKEEAREVLAKTGRLIE